MTAEPYDTPQLKAYLRGYGDGIDFVLDRVHVLKPEPEPARDGTGSASLPPHHVGIATEGSSGTPSASPPQAGRSDPSTDPEPEPAQRAQLVVEDATRAEYVQQGMVMALRAMAETFQDRGLIEAAMECERKAEALGMSTFREWS